LAPTPQLAEGRPFTDFNLHESIIRGLSEAGYIRATPIQEQCLPLSLQGLDVAGQAQTGTGKTAAFLITIFSRLRGTERNRSKGPSALIITPTRELATQILEDCERLGKYTGLSWVSLIGGLNYGGQEDKLHQGVDIVIGTPGRSIDFIKRKTLRLRNVSVLVIDEADRMFDMGFLSDLRYILKRLPPYERRQSMLFSATLSYRVMELAYEYMNLPQEVMITPRGQTLDTVEQSIYHLAKADKSPFLLGLLKKQSWNRVLIFVNTRRAVEWLTRRLRSNGYPAQGISGDLPQKNRLQLIRQFKDGTIKVLVATDVASRGLHIEDIDCVINYDLPQDREDYLHRIGRTARAGKEGIAISLACEDDVYSLEGIESFIGMKIPVRWADDKDLAKDRSKEPARIRTRPERKGVQRQPRAVRSTPENRPDATPTGPEVSKVGTSEQGARRPRTKRRRSPRPKNPDRIVPPASD
jgi:ATP-dependent RNA helicase RhlB